MQEKTAVRVISVKSSVDRQQLFDAQASELAYSYYDAHTDLVVPLQYDENLAMRRFGRSLSPEEIGCYCSHYKCWEWLANSKYDQAIIMEDDIIVDWDVVKLVAKVDFHKLNISILRMFSTHPFKWNIVQYRFLSPHYHLVQTQDIVFGLQCYLITKVAAQKLVKDAKQIWAPVDWIVSRYWQHKVLNFMLMPHPVIERMLPSLIDNVQKQYKVKYSPKTSLRRLFWRIQNKLLKNFYNIFLLKKLPFGSTIDEGDAYLFKNVSEK